MHPKFLLISDPKTPLIGTFVYGMVGLHKDLIQGYGKPHGGGWYEKDDKNRTMTLYGSSGDYGEPRLAFLNRIPAHLKGYRFYYRVGYGFPANELDLQDVEWF